jgi:inorganic pyrophosphatase
MEAEEEIKIYQTLPVLQENPQFFRLTQISEIKKYFEDEIEFRRKLFSKYKKAFDVITGINHFLNI